MVGFLRRLFVPSVSVSAITSSEVVVECRQPGGMLGWAEPPGAATTVTCQRLDAQVVVFILDGDKYVSVDGVVFKV